MSEGPPRPVAKDDGLPESQEEWKWKLEALQGQHQRETAAQQREHLDQLHLLQKKLIQDISVNMNMGDLVKKKIEMDEADENTEEKELDQRDTETTLTDGSNLNPNTVITPDRREHKVTYVVTSPLKPPTLPGRDSLGNEVTDTAEKTIQEEQHNPSLPTNSKEEEQEKEEEEEEEGKNSALVNSSKYDDSNKPCEDLVPPFPPNEDGDDDSNNNHNSYSQSSYSPSSYHHHLSHLYNPSISSPPTTPRQSWTTPVPAAAFKSSSLVSSDLRTYSPHNSSLSHLQMSYEPSPGLHSEQESSFRRSVESHLLRSNLTQKHARHMEDLRNYYELEISLLVDKLGEERGDVTVKTTPTRRSLNFDAPPSESIPRGVPEGTLSEQNSPRSVLKTSGKLLKSEKSENLRLEAECSRLYQLLEEANRQCHVLLDQEKKAEKCALEWQGRSDSAEKTIGALESRLEITVKQLQDQDLKRRHLQSDLQVIMEELHLTKQQRNEDIGKIDQIFHEFEVLQLDNNDLRRENEHYGAELVRTNAELTSLKASLEKYKSMDLRNKGTIHTLEDEVRHLEHLKNRNHNMGTHYELGTYKSPDADGIKSRSYSSSPYHHGAPIPREQHLPLQKEESPVEITPGRSMTRKKWLEPSDPGLFGGTPKYNEESSDLAQIPRQDNNLRSSLSPSGKEKMRSDDVTARRSHHADVDSMLKAIKDGRITTGDHDREKAEERIKKHIEIVAEADRRLSVLNSEKDKIESALRRTPRAGGKINRADKQMQFDKERRLEEVAREMSSVRMVLRKHHALKK